MTEPQQEYIITGSELTAAERDLLSFRERRGDWVKAIMARPLTKTPEKYSAYTDDGIIVSLCACLEDSGRPDKACEYCGGYGFFVYRVRGSQEKHDAQVVRAATLAGRKIGKEETLDQLWEWLEIGVECKKPNAVIAQIADKIIKMRDEPNCIRREPLK
jgi:hypothetical protein